MIETESATRNIGEEIIDVTTAEQILLAILHRFESQALARYEAVLPALADEPKKALVRLLAKSAEGNSALQSTTIEASLDAVLKMAVRDDLNETLLTQGLVLEPLALVIYEAFGGHAALSPATTDLFSAGKLASAAAVEQCKKMIETNIGSGDVAWKAFTSSNTEFMKKVIAFGSSMDVYLSGPLEITFADLMGDYVSELLPHFTDLGIDRRKAMAFLTQILMAD
jgi:hypothetical protein